MVEAAGEQIMRPGGESVLAQIAFVRFTSRFYRFTSSIAQAGMPVNAHWLFLRRLGKVYLSGMTASAAFCSSGAAARSAV